MSRTSHVEMRRRLADISSKISNQELFTSKEYAAYLTDMTEAATNKYATSIKVKVIFDEDLGVAWTDNANIHINAANKITTSFSQRQTQSESLIGLNAHEIGHILFSDFVGAGKFISGWETGNLYPFEPKALTGSAKMNYDEIRQCYETGNTIAQGIIAETAFKVLNALEDAYIEARMCYLYPGIYAIGIQINNARFLEQVEAVERQIEKGYEPFSILFNMLLQYTLSGDINVTGEYTGELLYILYDCLALIDNAIFDDNSNNRFAAANEVFIKMWPCVKALIKTAEDAEQNGSTSEEAINQATEKVKNQTPESSEAPTGKGSGKVGNENVPADQYKQALGHKPRSEKLSGVLQAAHDKGSNEQQKDGFSDEKTKQDAGEKTGQALTDKTGSGDCENNFSNSVEELIPSGDEISSSLPCAEVSQDEGNRIAYHETNVFDSGSDGVISRNKNYTGSGYHASAEDIERILSEIAKSELVDVTERELLQTLQTNANSLHYGNAHKGVNVCVHRMSSMDYRLVEQYNRISQPLLLLSKQLKSQFLKRIKEEQLTGKQTGLYLGRRLNVRDVVKDDGRIFCNNRLPNDRSKLAVAVLNDESGSMSKCDRVTKARAASIVIYDFCRSLNIPIAIYGHTADRKHNANIYAHAEFNSVDGNDKYRLMDISARNCNRDGVALRFVAEQLIKRSEERRILIIISDGQPNSGDYHGSAAEDDLKSIKREYTNKGITLFAGAIGEDTENIKRIYGNGFLDLTNLDKLPVNLTRLIAAYI